MLSNLFYTLIIFAAFGGFLLAFYIWHKKSSSEKLVCPIGADCDAVVHSKYASFFGIPVEVLGIFYYGLVGVSYGIFLAVPALVSAVVLFFVLTASAAALLFSLYLTFIQAVLLRQWCTWCLLSAGFCIFIFGAALAGSDLKSKATGVVKENFGESRDPGPQGLGKREGRGDSVDFLLRLW